MCVLHLRLVDRTQDCSTLQQGDLNKRWNSEVVVCDGCSGESGYILASNPQYAQKIDAIGLRPFLQPCGNEEKDNDPSSNAQTRRENNKNSFDLMVDYVSPGPSGPYIGLLLQTLLRPSPAVRAASSRVLAEIRAAQCSVSLHIRRGMPEVGESEYIAQHSKREAEMRWTFSCAENITHSCRQRLSLRPGEGGKGGGGSGGGRMGAVGSSSVWFVASDQLVHVDAARGAAERALAKLVVLTHERIAHIDRSEAITSQEWIKTVLCVCACVRARVCVCVCVGRFPVGKM